MSNILLTSAGFDNKKIEEKFLELVDKPVGKIKVIFIPTAAITEEQKAIVPFCEKRPAECRCLTRQYSLL